MSTLFTHSWTKVLFITAAALLAFEPVLWLTRTWIDPSYDSTGFTLFIITLALFLWSLSSPKINAADKSQNLPIILLFVSALVRLIGQVFAVNMIGAFTLIIDIYAIAKILELDKRLRAISPFWIAISFAFSLPLERIIQRFLGYGLQNISADGACVILQSTIDNVMCEGVRIIINNQDVLVDLPCSGTRAFLLLLFFYSLSNAHHRLSNKNAMFGFFITIVSAYFINVLRICVLAIFIGFPNYIFNIDVMSQPTHDVIGLLVLSLGAVPIALWARSRATIPQLKNSRLPSTLIKDAWWLLDNEKKLNKGYLAIGLMVVAIIIVQIPKRAFDVSRKTWSLNFP